MKNGPFKTSGDRAEIAADWVERLTAGNASHADIAALRIWVKADPLNRQAYEAARATWVALPATRLRRRNVQRAGWGMALAASIAALAIFLPVSHDYQTQRGQISEVRLPDGTIAWLDGDSAIDVDMTPTKRTITLAEGRVALKVGSDARPFAVETAGTTITDIGTEFLADREGDLRVAVREGEVEVERGGEHTRLRAGRAAVFEDDEVRPISDGVTQFAWRDGRIVLDRVPLAEALRELDRYYPGSIELTDEELASRRVSGTLFTNDPEGGLETIARSQDLELSRFLWITSVSSKRN